MGAVTCNGPVFRATLLLLHVVQIRYVVQFVAFHSVFSALYTLLVSIVYPNFAFAYAAAVVFLSKPRVS